MARFAVENWMLVNNPEEDKFVKLIIYRVAISSVKTTTKTLIALGYEPFPLSMGKTLTGKNTFFLPNVFSYAKQLAASHPLGLSVLCTGCDSGAIGIVVRASTMRWGPKYFHDVFGYSEYEDEDERDISDCQSFGRALRGAIRDSMVRTVAVFAARPFTVVGIRQIAQLVGGEAKYLNVSQSIRLILTEEGIGGLFSGVIPQLCSELLFVCGCAVASFAAERGLTRTYDRGPAFDLEEALEHLEGDEYDKAEKKYKEQQKVISFIIPPFVSYFTSPFSVVSTVMACVGSGLVVSFVPYNPTFNNWFECYEYTKALSRGGKVYREHTGAVSVGMDKQLYASNKHFA